MPNNIVWTRGPHFVVRSTADPNVLRVERQSPRTLQMSHMDLPITLDRLEAWSNRRLLIQEAFPHLTAEQREFIMTGYTPEDWNILFPPEEDT